MNRIDAMTGLDYTHESILSRAVYPFSSLQVFDLDCRESVDQTNMMAIFSPEQAKLFVYPDTPEAIKAFESTFLKDDVFRFYLTQGRGSKLIQGYSVTERNGVCCFLLLMCVGSL
jgi:hypothetical protein